VKLTLRTRLTLVYGGLFLAGGVFMLLLTYGLVQQSVPEPGTMVHGTQELLAEGPPRSRPSPRPTR
jgi:hypothetical protein